MNAAITAAGAKRSIGGSNYSENDRIPLNASTGALVLIEGEEILFPVGCRSLEMQSRFCGDVYAEIKGDEFYVAGFGPDHRTACRAALAKVPV